MSKSSRWRINTRLKYNNIITRYCGGKCQSCGYNVCTRNLAFHHVNPENKSELISTLLRATKQLNIIIAEVDKCVMVCHNCHGEIHEGLRKCPEINHAERQLILQTIKDEQPKTLKQSFHRCKCGNITDDTSIYCSKDCHKKYKYKINWPENLPELVLNSSKMTVAKNLGVSDKAVAKRLRTHHP